MALNIRLRRLGRRNRPFYRITVADARFKRDGRNVEILGFYDPLAPDERKYSLKKDRAEYWLSVGAKPSATVVSIFKHFEVPLPAHVSKSKSARKSEKKRAKAAAEKKDKPKAKPKAKAKTKKTEAQKK